MAIDPTLAFDTELRMRSILAMLARAGTCDGDAIFRSLLHAASDALGTDYAFIGELVSEMPDHVRVLEFLAGGEDSAGFIYNLDSTPCKNVVNQQFRYYARDVQSRFSDPHMRELRVNAYAAIPLYDSKKRAIGLMAVMSRSTLPDESLTRSVLGILSVRAAAELERRDALEARHHSEVSYRAILESAEDAAFVYDIDTGAILDVNSRTCEIYGYTKDELLELDIGALSSGVPPYTRDSAAALVERAKAGETVRSEWHRRNKDGSLHWDEIVIRKTMLGGHPRILIFAREITERIRAEAKLRASEEQYRAIFNASVDGMALWSPDGRLVDVNPAFAAMLGYGREAILAGDPRQWVHPDTYPVYDRLIAGLRSGELAAELAGGQVKRIEGKNVTRDGRVLLLDMYLVGFEYQGQPHVLAMKRDITERAQAEARLSASEEQYRAIFNASVDGMALWNANGHMVDVNPAFALMHGFDRDEMLRADPRDFIDPESLHHFNRFLESLRKRVPFAAQAKGRHKDGSVFEVDVSGMPIEYGGMPHMLSIVRDVTEAREREAALRKSEERLRATVEAGLDCIISMDGLGNIIGFNPAAEACFGYRRDEVLGLPLADVLIPERYRERHRLGLVRHRHTGKGPFLGRRVEVTAQRADGTEFPAELAIAVARGPDDNIFVGYLRDITERKAAEQERLRLEAQLRQAQKMEAIGHLTGGIAHDFNNILTGVMGYIGMAQERLEHIPDDTLNRYMDRARHAVERARDLIQQMLTFSRGQRGAPQQAKLAPLVKNAVRLLESTLPSSIEIHTELAEDLPPVSIDPVHLEQILMNLCINARDAMRNHGRLFIGVSRMECTDCLCRSCLADASGAYAALTVRDAGSGIEAKNLDRLFEPFFTTKEVGKGSGMGLAVVHGIVHEHGGHILVESEPGKGTAITVLFPLLKQTALDLSDDRRKNAASVAAALNGRVLLVDDDALVREYMLERLNEWGLQVDACENGPQALALFELAPDNFSAAIVDQTMPKMTGMELAQRLYLTRPDLPVLLYTGYGDAHLEVQARAAGIHALLSKPLDNQLLLRTLQEMLD